MSSTSSLNCLRKGEPMGSKETYNYTKSRLTAVVGKLATPVIQNFYDTKTKIDAFRTTIWYMLKDEDALKYEYDTFFSLREKGSHEDFAEDVSTKIGKLVETKFLPTYPDIYDVLGLSEDLFEESRLPFMVISEKKSRKLRATTAKYGSSYLPLEGQATTVSQITVGRWLDKHRYQERHVFVIVDFDPAGLQIYNVIKRKVQSVAPSTCVHLVEWWKDASNHPFTTYRLKPHAVGLTGKWMGVHRETGSEFSDPVNLEVADFFLKRYMDDKLSPFFYAEDKLHYFRQELLSRKVRENVDANNLRETIEKLRLELEEKKVSLWEEVLAVPTKLNYSTSIKPYRAKVEAGTLRTAERDYLDDILPDNTWTR